MKRRFGMWIGILIILIVGISVTRMTKDFVVSKGVAASSIITMADMGVASAALAGGGQVEVAAETEQELAILEEFGDSEVLSEDMNAAFTEEPTAAGVDMSSADTYSNGPVRKSASTENGELKAASESESIAVPGVVYPGQESSEIDTGTRQNYIISEASSHRETVKSPLDPVIETKPSLTEDNTDSAMMIEDFFERFETAEATSVKLWDNTTMDNVVAYNAAAEQERVLWDYELNLVYGEIRERMSAEEAEALKHMELDWLKERDQYAEKMASKSPIMNAQKQNPVYTRALAEKTKERCYWLLAEYEDVLSRQEQTSDIKTEK